MTNNNLIYCQQEVANQKGVITFLRSLPLFGWKLYEN